MFENEIKKEYRNLYLYAKELDERMVKTKVALHTLEKLGVNVDDMYKELDELGMDLYKIKNIINESYKK